MRCFRTRISCLAFCSISLIIIFIVSVQTIGHILEVMLVCLSSPAAVQEASGVEGGPELDIHDLAQDHENLIRIKRWKSSLVPTAFPKGGMSRAKTSPGEVL